MNKKLIFIFLVFVAVCLLESEAKKIPNPYKVLGIKQNANQEDIRQAFKRRSKKYHPDRNKKDPRAKQKFQQVVNAYQLLKDSQKRRIYDQTGGDDPQQFQQQGFQNGGFGGFPGGGFGGFPGGGFGGFGGGGFPGGGFGGFQQGNFGHQGGQQRRAKPRAKRQGKGQRQRATYSFSYGGQQGSSFNFDM